MEKDAGQELYHDNCKCVFITKVWSTFESDMSLEEAIIVCIDEWSCFVVPNKYYVLNTWHVTPVG